MSHIKLAKEVFSIEMESLEKVKNALDENFDQAVDFILNTKGRIVITGMGKSGLVGRKISATLSSTGTPSIFMHPGEAYHGDLGIIGEDDIIIAISNSGETEEVLRLLSFFKDNKNKVLAMSSNKNSTLGKYSDWHLNIEISKEACSLELAPTSSTTACLVMGDALAVCLMKARGFAPENFARFHPGGSLGRRLLVKAKDIMHVENLPLINPDDNFINILGIITKGRLGIGVIVNKDKTILGIITDGDIRRTLEKEKEKALSLTALEFMTKNPFISSEDAKLAQVEQIMIDKKITTLLIGENQILSGIVHRLDL